MDLPYDVSQRQRVLTFVSERLGQTLTTPATELSDDQLEELLFRIECGEF